MRRMKDFTRLAVVMGTAAILSACGDSSSVTAQKAAKEASATLETTKVDVAAIAKMSPMELMENATVQSNQLADVLANVKDEASAQIAIAEMRALGPQLTAVGERLENLNEDEIKLSLKTMKSMQSFAEAQMRIMSETGRIANEHPELRETMMEGFEDIEIIFK